MPTETTTYKLDDLAKAAGVSPRTVRYYVQRGLLPAPAFRGKDTAYSHEHLLRLRGIKHLQDRFLPLDAIQAELDRRTPRELEEMLSGAEPNRTAAGGSLGPPLVRGEDATTPDQGPYRTPPPIYRAPGASERIGWVIPARGAGWTRTAPVPGLELHLADDADEETRRLHDQVLDFIARTTGGR